MSDVGQPRDATHPVETGLPSTPVGDVSSDQGSLKSRAAVVGGVLAGALALGGGYAYTHADHHDVRGDRQGTQRHVDMRREMLTDMSFLVDGSRVDLTARKDHGTITVDTAAPPNVKPLEIEAFSQNASASWQQIGDEHVEPGKRATIGELPEGASTVRLRVMPSEPRSTDTFSAEVQAPLGGLRPGSDAHVVVRSDDTSDAPPLDVNIHKNTNDTLSIKSNNGSFGDQAFPLDLSAWSFDAAGNPDVRQPLGGAEMGLNADTVTTDQVDKAAQEITVTSESQGEEDYEAGKGPGVADSVSVFLPDAKRGMPPF